MSASEMMSCTSDFPKPESQSPCRKFLDKQCKVKKAEFANITSLKGGKWLLPSAKKQEFFKQYFRDVEDGYELYFTERKHPEESNPLIVDLDFAKHVEGNCMHLDGQQYTTFEVTEAILKKLADMCDEHMGSSIGCDDLTGWRLAVNNGNVNVHAVCQGVYVNKQQSESLFIEVQDQLKAFAPDYDWKKIIDPLTNGGLRMLSSHNLKEGSEVYIPVDSNWKPIPLTAEVMEEWSILHARRFPCTSAWKGNHVMEREWSESPSFSLPKVEGMDVTDHATAIAVRAVNNVTCKVDRVDDNRVTFSYRGHRDCAHSPEGHDRNRLSLIYTSNGAVLMRCLQSECLKKGAVHVGSWKVPCMFVDEAGQTHKPQSEMVFDEGFLHKMATPWRQAVEDKNTRAATTYFLRCSQYISKYHVHIISSNPVILRCKYDNDGCLAGYTSYSTTNFIKNFKSCHGAFPAWLADPHRRVKCALGFNPSGLCDDETEFNTFTGHPAERQGRNLPYDASKLVPVQRLMREVLCNHNGAVYDYLTKWLACVIRGQKTGSMLVVNSVEGTGKSLFFDNFCSDMILGRDGSGRGHGCAFVTEELDNIVGKFNSVACRRQLIVADDARPPSHGPETAKLRGMACKDSEICEAKGVEPQVIPKSYANYVFATNFDTAHPITVGDRRHMFMQCNNAHAKDMNYLQPIIDSLPEAAPHFYKWLMSIDISNFHPQNDRPDVEVSVDMRKKALKPVVQYVKECMDIESFMCGQGTEKYLLAWPSFKGKLPGSLEKVDKDPVYNGYVLWATQAFGLKHGAGGIGDRVFSADMKKFCGIDCKTVGKIKKYHVPCMSQVKLCMQRSGQWVEDPDCHTDASQGCQF